MQLLLVRHGQSTWNAKGLWQGWADPPLSDLGEAQAAEAAERVAELEITGVASSDLVRALRTAQIIAGRLGLEVGEVDMGLREYDVGDWCGLTRPEIEERWPGLLAEWHTGQLKATPGGETRHHFLDRAVATLGRLRARDHLGDRVLVVTHGGLVKAMQRHLGVETDTVPNLGGRWFEVGAGGDLAAGEPVALIGEEARTMSPSA